MVVSRCRVTRGGSHGRTTRAQRSDDWDGALAAFGNRLSGEADVFSLQSRSRDVNESVFSLSSPFGDSAIAMNAPARRFSRHGMTAQSGIPRNTEALIPETTNDNVRPSEPAPQVCSAPSRENGETVLSAGGSLEFWFVDGPPVRPDP
jgi:hypothetical protein